MGVETVLEIDERIFRPEMLADFLASDQFARMFQQKREDGDGLALELNLRAVLRQFARLAVEFERSETDPLCGWDWHVHPTIAATPAPWPTYGKNLA